MPGRPTPPCLSCQATRLRQKRASHAAAAAAARQQQLRGSTTGCGATPGGKGTWTWCVGVCGECSVGRWEGGQCVGFARADARRSVPLASHQSFSFLFVTNIFSLSLQRLKGDARGDAAIADSAGSCLLGARPRAAGLGHAAAALGGRPRPALLWACSGGAGGAAGSGYGCAADVPAAPLAVAVPAPLPSCVALPGHVSVPGEGHHVGCQHLQHGRMGGAAGWGRAGGWHVSSAGEGNHIGRQHLESGGRGTKH